MSYVRRVRKTYMCPEACASISASEMTSFSPAPSSLLFFVRLKRSNISLPSPASPLSSHLLNLSLANSTIFPAEFNLLTAGIQFANHETTVFPKRYLCNHGTCPIMELYTNLPSTAASIP